MAGAPARFNDVSDGDGLEDRLADLEQRLQTLQIDEERLRNAEQNALDASARRIHDFERRLELEWLALRQLHEEPLKNLQHHTATIDTCLNLVREALQLLRDRITEPAPVVDVDQPHDHTTRRPHVATIVIVIAVAMLAFVSYHLWSQLEDANARSAAAQERTSQLHQLVLKQIQESERTVQRLSAETLTTAARAERLANVLAAPDVRMYPLRGQRPAAAAEGQVFFSPSRGVLMTASRLPPASAEQAYQIWATTQRGPVSLGFASIDALGRASTAFETPPELSQSIVGFIVTVEPTGGSVKPTGSIVLAS
jgi:hypothetical protein